jgi:DNA replication initiation complex subunit (GINS family)
MEKDMIEVLVAGVNDYKKTFIAELKNAADAKAAADTANAQTGEKSNKGATPKKPTAAPAAEKSKTDASKPANPAA